jgi:hypothetical protein
VTANARQIDRGGSPAQMVSLELQLRKLRSMEDSSSVYQEMLRAATERILAGGDYAHGWGEFSANGDPRKRRKVAS